MTSGLASEVVEAAVAHGLTLGCAESLTGGAVSAALVGVPGASAAVRGGIVAYAMDAKHDLLGVGEDLLAGPGPVSRETAEAMAAGARRVLGVDIAVSTTGVAGPEPHGGAPVGTVWIGVSSAHGEHASEIHAPGDRESVRHAAVEAALAALRNEIARVFTTP